MPIQAVRWSPANAVRIVDQRRLPEEFVERDLETIDAVAEAIRSLAVRGAPLIGITAAMGLVAGLRETRAAAREQLLTALDGAVDTLERTRPTAVNLAWALERMRGVARRCANADAAALWTRLRDEATAILEEDCAMCRRIGAAGLALLPRSARILTHCNAGALATGGIGTALAPIYLAHEAGGTVHVHVDETRPVRQGARLTAWELVQAGIPCTVLADGAAGALLARGAIDLVIVGADRIAANGDFANQLGTYALAVLARYHGVPLYCAAPSSTIDRALASGDAIPIEERSRDELDAPAQAAVWNPAFDVTPANLVSAYITDRGVVHPPFPA